MKRNIKKRAKSISNILLKVKKTILVIIQLFVSVFKISSDKKKETNNEEKEEETKENIDTKEKSLVEFLDKEIERLKKENYSKKTKDKIKNLKTKINSIESKYEQYLLIKRLENIEYTLIKRNETETTKKENILETIDNTLNTQLEELINISIEEESNNYILPNKEEKEDNRANECITNTIAIKEQIKENNENIKEGKSKKPLESSKSQIFINSEAICVSTIKEKEPKLINENKDIVKTNKDRNTAIVNYYDKEIKKDNIDITKLKISAITKAIICITAAINIINKLNNKSSISITKKIIDNTINTIKVITGRKNKRIILAKRSKRALNTTITINRNPLNEMVQSFKELKSNVLKDIPSELKNSIDIKVLLEYLNRLEQEMNILIERNLEKSISKTLIKRI